MKEKQQYAQSKVTFSDRLRMFDVPQTRLPTQTVQINVGKRCNLSCTHCHVGAGPNRTEMMSKETMDRIFKLLETSKSVDTVDITGGAPEMNPNFRYLMDALAATGKSILVRSNATLLCRPPYDDLPQFLAKRNVTLIISLPCFLKENVDARRGDGVFEKTIEALLRLNAVGYGNENLDPKLYLMFNPPDDRLPAEQSCLENEFRSILQKSYGISFTGLFALVNMPIGRFYEELRSKGTLDEYFEKLAVGFNEDAAQQIMCRSLISIGWDGRLYDCDFNQALDCPIQGEVKTVFDAHSFDEPDARIRFDRHCYGCTAGFGSSCTGALR